MKIEVLEEKENPLLDRKELVVKIIHDDSTPTRDVVKSKAMAKLKGKKDTFILDSIKTKFGARESIAQMRIYGSKKRVLEIESEHVLKKNALILDVGKKKDAEVKEKPAKEEKTEGTEKKESKAEKVKPAKEEKAESVEKIESKAENEKPIKGKVPKEKEEATPKKDKAKEEST